MILKTLVKANSILNLTDARYFAAHEVEWLGYCFDQNSTDYINPQSAKGIIDWVVGPKVVAEFGAQEPEEILTTASFVKADFIQLPSTYPYLKSFQATKPLMIYVHAEDLDTAEKEMMNWKDLASIFILDCSSFSYEHLRNISSRFQILLSHSLYKNNFPMIIEESAALGICVQGGSEEKIGMKNFDPLDYIFDTLRV